MRRYLAFLTLFLSLATAVWPTGVDGQTTIEKLGTLFHRIDEKENLFEVSSEYALQPGFDTSGNLTQVRVVPKYFFEASHPEWPEPDSPPSMPLKRYRDLLRDIQKLKALGALVHRGKIGITLNLRTSFWDQYKKGIVERTMTRESPTETYSVNRFAVHYLHTVSGTVDAKDSGFLGKRIKIDGKWYWTPTSVFKTLAVGRSASIRAAGPLSEEPKGGPKSVPPPMTTIH